MADKICKICRKDAGCNPSKESSILICGYCVQILYNKNRDAVIKEIRALPKSLAVSYSEKLSIIMNFFGLSQYEIEEGSKYEQNYKFKRFNENSGRKSATIGRFKRERAKGNEDRTW